jgi:hypothetical protein
MKIRTAIGLTASAATILAFTVPASASEIFKHPATSVSAPTVTAATGRPAGTKYGAMTVTGINAKVAHAHGYRVVTLADGTLASITSGAYTKLGAHPGNSAVRKAASTTYNPSTGVTGGTTERTLGRQSNQVASANGGVRPDNYVYGNCGDSYYFLGAAGADWSSLTGYDVRDAVDDFSWRTQFSDPTGEPIESKDYGEESTGPSWEGDDGEPPYLTLDDTSDGVIWHGTWSGVVAYGYATLVDGTTCLSGDPADSAAN